MSISFKKLPLVAAIAMVTVAPIIQAQMLEEVIVTAQKRTESLQDVPISVSAIQGTKLEEAGIANMSALADYVPNLTISDAAVNTNIYLRGMGSGNNRAFEQSVGMYIDGVYMGRGRQYRSPFLDIQRVEVLRGPQGTLFGKNTVAGAINVTTASPEMGEEFNGSIAASIEDNDGFITEGYISGSVTDTLSMRLAFKYNENSGTFDNDFLNDDELDIEDTSYRLTAVWQPTDNLDVNVKYSQSKYERTGAPSTTRQYLDPAGRAELFPNKSAFAGIAYLVTDTFFPDFGTIAGKEGVTFKDNGLSQDGTVGIGYNQDGTDNDTNNFVTKLDYSMGDFLLTSITGYSSYEAVDSVDVDWLPIQFLSRDDTQEFEQFSQEFRITSPGGEFFDYVAGAYYEKSDLEFDGRVTIDTNMDGLVPAILGVDNLLLLLTGMQYGANQVARNHHYQLDTESYAVFGQGTFNISDSFRVTLGLRYTKEDKDMVSDQCLGDTNADPDRLTSLAICQPGNPFISSIFASTFNTYNYDYKDDRSTDAWIPAMNVQWNVFEDTMLYLSLSKGFKSGGFTAADDGEPAGFTVGQVPEFGVDPQIFTEPSDDFEFEDEEVNALEIGGKHTLLGGGMTLNWAYFYTEYTDLQTSIFKGVGFGVSNADATVQGIEIDMAWQVTDSLRLGANGSWLDSEYDDFADAPCTAIQLDIDKLCGTPAGFSNNDQTGSETNYAPEFSYALFADYSLMMSNGIEFFAGGELNFKDSYSPAGDNDPIDRLESFHKTNLRFGLRGDAWEVMAYGRNVFDEEVFSQSADTPVLAGSHFNYMDEGAVFGLRGKYSF